MLKDLDTEITRLMIEHNSSQHSNDSNGCMSELRDHLIEIHTRLSHGLLKRLIAYDEQIKRQE